MSIQKKVKLKKSPSVPLQDQTILHITQKPPKIMDISNKKFVKLNYILIIIVILLIIVSSLIIWLFVKKNSKSNSSNTVSRKTTPSFFNFTTKYAPYNILSICGSNDSKFIYALSNNSVLNISRDNGLSWTSKMLDLEVIVDNIMTNFDGSILLVYKTNSNFYAYSKDSADTWTSNNIPKGDYYPLNIKMMSMNYDMSILFLIDSKQTSSTTPAPINGIYSGYLYYKYLNKDWVKRLTTISYSYVDCNQLGNIYVVCTYNGSLEINIKPIFNELISTSTTIPPNDFVTIKPNVGIRYWKNISITSEGNKIALCSINGGKEPSALYIIKTQNKNSTNISDWDIYKREPLSGDKEWNCVKYSDNGLFLVVAELEGNIYSSVDDGLSWLQVTIPANNWQQIFVDNLGYVTAITKSGNIYTSKILFFSNSI